MFYIFLNPLNDTSKDILLISKLIFVLNRYKDISLFEIEFMSSYKETSESLQIVKANLLL